MTLWQKRARFVVAVFGLAVATVVYFAINGRPAPPPAEPVRRIDPAATAESVGGNVQRFRSGKRDFVLSFDTQLTYPDGSTRMKVVTVRVLKDDGRSYVVTAGEALSAQDQTVLQFSSGVKLQASDGFALTTDRASYNKDEGTIRSEVPVAFSKGRMSGTGTNIDYNETSDVLTIGEQAHVTTVDEEGATTLEFASGSAVLDRLQDLLTLEGSVHVLREGQVMDADRATAHLAPNDEFVTFLELRGSARVEGGAGTLQAMSARDIDLDYSDDGSQLERVVLTGGAGITMAGAGGADGRQFTGGSLDISLAPDGSVTSASGRDTVRMVLPASADAPVRSISGNTFDASGAAGRGLTGAQFLTNVEYREQAARPAAARIVHSRRLDLALAEDAVTDATFTGDVSFEEQAFRAQAAVARYNPAAGTLHLTGSDTRGLPCVADDQISVDAPTIDVTVESRRLTASGGVKTALRPTGASRAVGNSPCSSARARGAAAPREGATAGTDTRLPGLLKQDQVAIATADALEYLGTGKPLALTGSASLVQGETSLRGRTIRIDQERGDLIVSGGARSLIVQGPADAPERVDGRAEEIRYTDARRLIEYLNAPGETTRPASGQLVRVNGPEGDLAAGTVEVVLAKSDGRAERLEAYRNVTARIGEKTATADRLTYVAAEDRYDMRGAGTVPVRIVDGCLEASGKALTFYRGDNRIVVDGRDEMRTRTQNSACPQPATPPR